MCEECDAELFMVLPRIAWLQFLFKPKDQAEFLSDLLPHRFIAPKMEDDSPTHRQRRCFDPEVLGLLDRFKQVKELVLSTTGATGGPAATAKSVWEVLVRRVVNGVAGGSGVVEKDTEAALATGARAAVDGLVHELERWSIELQRHCPEDWNQCSAILVRCLVGGDTVRPRQKEVPFRV